MDCIAALVPRLAFVTVRRRAKLAACGWSVAAAARLRPLRPQHLYCVHVYSSNLGAKASPSVRRAAPARH